MSQRLERKGYKIKILCTDGYEGYASYKLAEKHYITKAETSLVESKNSLIRHYLARFHRRTNRYAKAFDMILNSLLILFHKSLLLTSILIYQCHTSVNHCHPLTRVVGLLFVYNSI